eukprot:755086-Hanusia_phi.AAC.1
MRQEDETERNKREQGKSEFPKPESLPRTPPPRSPLRTPPPRSPLRTPTPRSPRSPQSRAAGELEDHGPYVYGYYEGEGQFFGSVGLLEGKRRRP